MARLTPETRGNLARLGTAEVARALRERGLPDGSARDVRPLSPAQGVMVGPAFTLQASPTLHRVLERCPPGYVLVIDGGEDLRLGVAAALRLMQRGVAGLVTDGRLRDAADIARLGLTAYQQWRSNVPVVRGDIILGDGGGIAVIPADLVQEIVAELTEKAAFEEFVAEQVGAGHGIYGLYPPTGEQTLAAFREWRRLRGR